MPYKSKAAHNKWNRDRFAALSPEQKAAFRERRRIAARKWYWMNREICINKSALERRLGNEKKRAKKRCADLTDGYIKRCLVQRGWNKTEITMAHCKAGVWELIRMHIRAKREIRKCR